MQFKPFATLGNMFDILYIYVAIATQYWVVYFVAIAPPISRHVARIYQMAWCMVFKSSLVLVKTQEHSTEIF